MLKGLQPDTYLAREVGQDGVGGSIRTKHRGCAFAMSMHALQFAAGLVSFASGP
jgi:hypothetical protein